MLASLVIGFSVFNRQSHFLYSNLPVPGNLLTDNVNLHEHSSPKMSGHLELKASHYRDAGRDLVTYHYRFFLDLLIVLEVHILTYMPTLHQ